MSSTVSASSGAVDAPEPATETLSRLAIEAGKYVGVEAGDEIGVDEVRVQAEANGYTSDEIDRLLAEAGVDGVDRIQVPAQGDLFGSQWQPAGPWSDSIDNTGASAEPDSSLEDWSDRPATCNGGCSPEPLDDSTPDCYGLQTPITDDPDMVDKDRYLGDDGKPLSHFDAVGSYIEHRHGEATTAKRHGWTKGRQYYAKQQYRRGMALDRQLLDDYSDPTTVLISLRLSPPDTGRLTMLTSLKTSADATVDQLRYRLQNATDAPCDADEWEYMAVFAGTEARATPHLHIYVWVDGDVSPERFKPVVGKFVETCEFAPDDGTGNRPDGGAVSIEGNGTDDVPRVDDDALNPTDCEYAGRNSQGAVYVLTQLPHLEAVDMMARDELLHSSTTDAWGGQAFRASMSESDIRDEFLADAPV